MRLTAEDPRAPYSVVTLGGLPVQPEDIMVADDTEGYVLVVLRNEQGLFYVRPGEDHAATEIMLGPVSFAFSEDAPDDIKALGWGEL